MHHVTSLVRWYVGVWLLRVAIGLIRVVDAQADRRDGTHLVDRAGGYSIRVRQQSEVTRRRRT